MPEQKAVSPIERIWFVVNLIPKGNVSSYGKIADLAGLPGRARYVSTALKRAPKEMDLPWHRVVNSQGKISFESQSQAYQHQMELLRLDGVQVNRGRISLSEYEWKPDLATLMFEIPF
ncbi:MGMT family protein [Shewanella sp. D64]|uniref:MGMT family protein n=1 Tax=unclassified Shewanella TaxID=196818 RepID=UPI0022BA5D01|nr:MULTISPECIES: MGMT family protein [unclassified Shewanella]MEC4725296.1 MGMT family protein [Shewanella sp. D64]MEC4735858.1 MGMT family protein [Shewanella sp. E94]WBJ93171.1 MGMT family protein [Shewanella sp. MTB7]